MNCLEFRVPFELAITGSGQIYDELELLRDVISEFQVMHATDRTAGPRKIVVVGHSLSLIHI